MKLINKETRASTSDYVLIFSESTGPKSQNKHKHECEHIKVLNHDPKKKNEVKHDDVCSTSPATGRTYINMQRCKLSGVEVINTQTCSSETTLTS